MSLIFVMKLPDAIKWTPGDVEAALSHSCLRRKCVQRSVLTFLLGAERTKSLQCMRFGGDWLEFDEEAKKRGWTHVLTDSDSPELMPYGVIVKLKPININSWRVLRIPSLFGQHAACLGDYWQDRDNWDYTLEIVEEFLK